MVCSDSLPELIFLILGVLILIFIWHNWNIALAVANRYYSGTTRIRILFIPELPLCNRLFVFEFFLLSICWINIGFLGTFFTDCDDFYSKPVMFSSFLSSSAYNMFYDLNTYLLNISLLSYQYSNLVFYSKFVKKSATPDWLLHIHIAVATLLFFIMLFTNILTFYFNLLYYRYIFFFSISLVSIFAGINCFVFLIVLFNEISNTIDILTPTFKVYGDGTLELPTTLTSTKSSENEVELPNSRKNSSLDLLIEKINKMIAMRRQFVMISLTIICACLTFGIYLLYDSASYFESPNAYDQLYYPHEHHFFFNAYNLLSIVGALIGCFYLYKYPFDSDT